ncbi:MAG: TonB-dependent receptor plug domain-containing protein [Bacteroidota bacterium]
MLSYLQKTNTSLLFFAFLFSFQTSLLAQTFDEEQPLSEIITSIEDQFDVRFSYTASNIEGHSMEPPSKDLSLEETLNYLKQSTGLEFRTIRERYIAIYTNVNIGNQSVCGTLINTSTGKPIQGATVYGTSAVASTDDAGFFQLIGVSRSETINITYLGFDIHKLNSIDLLGKENCPLIFANINVNLLETVVLESYLTRGISKNAEGSVTITQQNYAILPSLVEPDILQIVQILPGVESVDETAANINIRGGKNDEVLLLWNGIRMYQSSHFFGLISALNPNLTDKVSIYKNGTHPRYGEGVSGVISMTSDDTVPEEITGGGGINFISANLYAKIPTSERFSFNISGRASINSGIGNPVYNQFYNRIFQNTVITNLDTNTEEGLRSSDEDFNFFDLSVKGIWDISKKDKITYNFLAINNSLDFTELFVDLNDSSSNRSSLEQSSNINGIQWKRKWNPKFSTQVNWHGSTYLLEESNQQVNTGASTTQENEVSETEFQIESTYRINKDLFLSAGFVYTDTEVNNLSNNNALQQSLLRRDAYFINSQWRMNKKKTIVSFGGRLTSYRTLDQQFLEPRISIFQTLSPRLSINLAAEQKQQGVLQFTDVNNEFLGVENKRWALANGRDLPLLESRQIELGSTYSKNNWVVNTNVYYKEVDGISASTQGFRNQLINNTSLGGYDIKGFELSISRKVEKLNAWLSYSFADSDFNFPEITPSEFPNSFAFKHSATVAATYEHNAFLFSFGSTFKNGNPFTGVVAGNEIIEVDGEPVINHNDPNSDLLENYFRVDMSAGYNFKIDETFDGKVNLALLNVFNWSNPLDTYFRLTQDDSLENSLNRIEQFSLGFTPNISFQLFF